MEMTDPNLTTSSNRFLDIVKSRGHKNWFIYDLQKDQQMHKEAVAVLLTF
jgi:hypothetical protein